MSIASAPLLPLTRTASANTPAQGGDIARVQLWRAALPGLDAVCVRAEGRGTFGPMLAERLTVGAVIAPCTLTDARGRTAALFPGQVLLVPPLELFRLDAGGGRWAVLQLLLAPSGAERHAPCPTIARAPHGAAVVEDDEAAVLLQSLAPPTRRPLEADVAARLRASVERIAPHLADAACDGAGARADEADVRRVAAHLRARVEEPHTLPALARIAGVSAYTLVERFADAYAMPPHAYLAMLRLARARRLLEQGIPPVRAARAAGFRDAADLSRRLVARLGISAEEYAAALAPPGAGGVVAA